MVLPYAAKHGYDDLFDETVPHTIDWNVDEAYAAMGATSHFVAWVRTASRTCNEDQLTENQLLGTISRSLAAASRGLSQGPTCCAPQGWRVRMFSLVAIHSVSAKA